MEIRWAPQRYYPQSGTYWNRFLHSMLFWLLIVNYDNRGNIWEQITTTASPGKRAFFGMASDGASVKFMSFFP